VTAPFAQGFGKRAHLIAGLPDYIQTGRPMVAMCGTVFVPTTFAPDDTVPRCRPCVEAEVSLLYHRIGDLMDRAHRLEAELAADDAARQAARP
jgi:hypothetical protein